MITLQYKYGIAAPHENSDLVHGQMLAAHRYRNTLVEIERGRRVAVRAAMAASSAAVATCEAQVAIEDATCEALASAMRANRKASRKRSETTADREALAEARNRKREATRALYAARDSVRAVCRACWAEKGADAPSPCEHATPEGRALDTELSRIHALASELQRSARQHSGTYWGTYLLVEKDMQASRGAPLYDPDGRTPHDPPFARWNNEGRVAVQFQGGAEVDEICNGSNSRIVVTRPNADIMAFGRRCERVAAARLGDLRMRIGSDGRAPIWAGWRLDMHRSLPEGCKVKWAVVTRKMIGPYPRWSVCFTVELAERPALPTSKSIGGAVAIDIGWRVIGDTLRVAAWHDEKGKNGELRLSARDLKSLREPAIIRSERDKLFDLLKARTKKMLDAWPNAPAWLQTAMANVAQWRTPKRFASVLRQWDERVFAGETVLHENRDLYFAIEAGLSSDHHLFAQESRRAIRSLRHRREIYRMFAAQFANQYETIVIERFDLRSVAERPETGEEDGTTHDTSRSNRHLAAVSELCAAVVHSARMRDCVVAAVNAVDSTRMCPSCGSIEDRNAADSVTLTCECGHSWDQDIEGAAPVLLRRWLDRPEDAKILAGAHKLTAAPGAVKKETRRERMVRAKARKKTAAEEVTQADT